MHKIIPYALYYDTLSERALENRPLGLEDPAPWHASQPPPQQLLK